MSTRYPGQDGRYDFPDMSDDRLHARIGELRAKAQSHVTQAKAAGANSAIGVKAREDAQTALSTVRDMNAELARRAEYAKNGGPSSSSGEIRRLDPEKGFAPSSGEAKGDRIRLTAAALREAASGAVTTGFVTGGQKNLSLTDATAVAVVPPGLRPLGRPASILDLVDAQATATPSFRFLRQTSRVNRAAVVAPGAVKPQSDYGITPVDRTLQVVAHLSDSIDEYALADVANLTSFVQAELEYGLGLAVESALFNDTGAAGELHGIAGESGVQVQAYADDLLSTTRRAVTKIEALGYSGGAFVVSPADLETIDLATASGSGEFQNARAPFDRAEAKLWGVPVVVSTVLEPGEAYLIGQDSLLIYSDPGAAIRVQWDRVNDDFSRNQIRCRLEGRFEIAVTRPEAIVKVATA